MASWTIEHVARRFAEAVETGRRLPRVGVQGYFSVWPAFVRDDWEGFAEKESVIRPLPPTPQAIDRMMEAVRWVQWLEVEQRHLVWLRAKRYEWHEIARRVGCHRSTAWRRWKQAMEKLIAELNSESQRHTFSADDPTRKR